MTAKQRATDVGTGIVDPQEHEYRQRHQVGVLNIVAVAAERQHIEQRERQGDIQLRHHGVRPVVHGVLGLQVKLGHHQVDDADEVGYEYRGRRQPAVVARHRQKQVDTADGRNKAVDADELARVSCPVKANTLIVSRMNTPDLVGACGYVEKDYVNLFLPDRLWQVHFSDGISVKYIWYYMNNRQIRSYYGSLAVGTSSSMQNISQDQFYNTLALMPDREEQNEIVCYLDRYIGEIDSAIRHKENLCSEMEAYKKSLIFEYVTGKKEV